MTRIAALNDWSLGSSEEEDVGPTREALEAQATKYYNEAINYLAHGNDERAHHHFSQVLLNPYVEKVGHHVVFGGVFVWMFLLLAGCGGDMIK